MRLDKFFSSQSLASRREVKELVRQGAVTVNGETVKKADCQINPDTDRITLHGKPVGYEEFVYYLLHKPQGVVSATEDSAHRTVVDLIPPEWAREGLFPVGRLDKDTTGLLLITNDGAFGHRLLSPKKHVQKVYHATVNVEITEAQITQFSDGVTLKDGYRCLPAKMRVLQQGVPSVVEITLYEGKYHQIKRMIAAVGGHVLALKRVAMGDVWLDDTLPEGAVKKIVHKDLVRFL